MTVKNTTRDFEPTWIEHLSRSPVPSLRLFCFPYAGGSADVYRAWQRWFPKQLDLCLVHLPGRGRNVSHRPFTQLTPLVAAIADRISILTEAPYALYGHSMGALISFELARELSRRKAASPKHLFISGRRAPQYPNDEPIIFNLPHDAFVAELKRLNGTPTVVLESPELMELFTAVLRADFEMVDTYRYSAGEPLLCPITVYGGREDRHVPVDSCHAWQTQTSAICKVRMVKGDHFFVRNPSPEFSQAFRADVLSALPDHQ